ncbi:MAG: ferritin-like domain-containing protein [Actinobacteria bacterium]|nr:ferritin-like domain-containing protein [Actinomycetota bacterium]
MDLNRDELRRHLRDAEREQREALPAWRDALHRIFERPGTPTAVKADALGVPNRRQLLRVGGATVAGAAVLASCGGGSTETRAGESGTTMAVDMGASTTASTPTTSAEEGRTTDVSLTKTATSLELLAVQIYDVVLGRSSTKLPQDVRFDQGVVDAATLFRAHHQAHAQALQALTTTLGSEPYDKPNAYLFDNVVKKALPSLTSQDAVVRFAYDVENLAASTYGYAAGVLSTPKLRQSLMGIGGVEARHAAALSMVIDATGNGAVPRSFLDTSGPARMPDDALVKA